MHVYTHLAVRVRCESSEEAQMDAVWLTLITHKLANNSLENVLHEKPISPTA